jgi:protease II
MKAQEPAPPVAARKPVRLSAHGIERIDDYAWLRDPTWRKVIRKPQLLSRAIRVHIEAENWYARDVLAPLAGLRKRLLEELAGRVEPTASEVPLPDGPFTCWREHAPGAEHPRVMRESVGGAKQVLVDGAAIALGKPYFSFGTGQHSPDHRLCAYLLDLAATKATACVCAIPDRDATCRTISSTFQASPGRRTARHCSMCGLTRTITHASCAGTGSARTRKAMHWSTGRRIPALRSRSV